jgi:ABC-type Zn uptake system ZnuABC Zn-binding protein ZnuA
MTHRRRRQIGTFGIGLSLATIALLSPGCRARDEVWPSNHPGPKVAVSFAPLYCFAINVAGDDAVVRNMMTSSGPHHFNPTDKDARLLQRADLFLINGLGLEGDKPAALANSSGNKKIKIIDLSASIPADQLLEGACNHSHEGHAHQDAMDPHVWLSPDYAILEVNAIRDAFKEADPSHAAGYDHRAADYIKKLQQLKTDGIALLKPKSDRKIVTFHDSMTYFAKTFDLNIVGVVQKKPGMEPNPKEFTELLGLCADKTNPIRVITVEPQYGTSSAAKQITVELLNKGVPDPQLVEFDPLETVVPDDLTPQWYELKMRANLEALAKAMK